MPTARFDCLEMVASRPRPDYPLYTQADLDEAKAKERQSVKERGAWWFIGGFLFGYFIAGTMATFLVW